MYTIHYNPITKGNKPTMRIDIPNVQGSGEKWLDVMRAICGDTRGLSLLDLCCFHAPYTPQLGFKERTYVDILDRGLDFKEEQQFFIKSDVFNYLLGLPRSKYFDWVVCSDGLEHFNQESGWLLLKEISQVSHAHVLFTPLGDHNIEAVETDDPDTHKSGWLPEHFEILFPGKYGYIVMPNFHDTVGAFFIFHHKNLPREFNRISKAINNLSWIESI